MYFLIEDDNLLKNIIVFGIKSVLIQKKIDSDPVYNKTFLRTKIKSHGDEVTNVYNKKNSKVRL